MSDLSDFLQSPAISGGGKTMKIQKFNTSGTWVKPVGVEAVHILLVGAGGGATLGALTNGSGGGGGGGRVLLETHSVSGDLNIIIGAGGLANNSVNATPAGTGGDSTITGGVILTSLGGFGGGTASTTPYERRCGGGRNASASTNLGGAGAGSETHATVESTVGRPTHHQTYTLGSLGSDGGTPNNIYNGTYFLTNISGKGLYNYGEGGAGGNVATGSRSLTYSGTSMAANRSWGQQSTTPLSNTGAGGNGGGGSATYLGTDGSDGYCEIIWFE